MLDWLTRIGRGRAATLLVAAYALCVLAPAAAFAFGDAARAAHCLTEEHGAGKAHSHSAPHQHGPAPAYMHPDGDGGKDGGQTQGSSCCGLVCVTALAGIAAPPLGTVLHSAPLLPFADRDRSGLAPDRLDRPPRPRASV